MKKLIMNGILKYFTPEILKEISRIPDNIINEIVLIIFI